MAVMTKLYYKWSIDKMILKMHTYDLFMVFHFCIEKDIYDNCLQVITITFRKVKKGFVDFIKPC